jgi:hypothetical protein
MAAKKFTLPKFLQNGKNRKLFAYILAEFNCCMLHFAVIRRQWQNMG